MNAPGKRRRADIDPDNVGKVLDELASARGWGHGLAVAKIREAWVQIVGPILESRCEPGSLGSDGVLVVRCDHGATANEVTILEAVIVSKVRELVPSARVTAVKSIVRKPRAGRDL